MSGVDVTSGQLRVGLDIGGTKTDAVAVDDSGSVIAEVRVATGFGPAAVLESTEAAVTALAELASSRYASSQSTSSQSTSSQPTSSRYAASRFVSVGIGIPGAVDIETGRVSHAVNLGVDNLELGAELGRRLAVPVRVENDVNAAALGAFHLLGRPDTESMAYLNLGTGLAAGLVLDGALWRGARGTAGEIGHIPIDPNGPLCPCGQRGCLEMVASGSAVLRQWPTNHPRPVQALFDAAAAGDPVASEVKTRLVENVAAAVRLLVLTVDVETVVIGGGISSLGQRLLDEVRLVLVGWAAASPFISSLELATRVELVPSQFSAAAVGAAIVGMIGQDVLHG